jgi:hypothetical protein
MHDGTGGGAGSPTKRGDGGGGAVGGSGGAGHSATFADMFDLAVVVSELSQLYYRRLAAHLEFIVSCEGRVRVC